MMLETMQPEELARRFHDTYETLAPHFGYETRAASAVPWEQVPANNKNLMIAVCRTLLAFLQGDDQALAQQCRYCEKYPPNACSICAVGLCLDHSVVVEGYAYCPEHDPRCAQETTGVQAWRQYYTQLWQTSPVKSGTEQAALDVLAALQAVSPVAVVQAKYNASVQAMREAETRNDAPAYLDQEERATVLQQFLLAVAPR